MTQGSPQDKQLVPQKTKWHINGQLCFEIFCAVVFLGMVGLVFYNALLRYVFRSSFPPSEEWARFLFIYIIYYGAIEACIIAYEYEKDVIDYYKDIVQRYYSLGSHPIRNKQWSALKLLKYRWEDGGLKYIDETPKKL